MIQRTLIFTTYLIMVSVITTLAYKVLGNLAGAMVEVFLYSYLNAYYCYEYKTAALDVDVGSSIEYFESQWEYFSGFGILFTAVLYIFKEVGSSLFFLIFPLMIVISLDEKG